MRRGKRRRRCLLHPQPDPPFDLASIGVLGGWKLNAKERRMLTIWNFEIARGYNELNIPHGAQALTVQMQGGRMQLWMLVDPNQPMIERRAFSVYGTGHAVPNTPGRYVATIQIDALVFHVFDGSRTA
jgi:hypothetical protein